MSTLRRASTKQGLQDLLWVTAQRRIEDDEEIEREQRRRARRTQSCETTATSPSPTNPNRDYRLPPDNAVCEANPKPNCQVALEEDEGFSDWTRRLEKRKQRQQVEQEYQDDHRPKHNETFRTNQITNQNEEEEQNNGKTEKKSQCKISFTSKTYMPHDMRHLDLNGELTERTSYLVARTISLGSNLSDQCGVGGEVEDAFLETEQKPERTRQSHSRKEEPEEQKYQQEQQEQDEKYKLKEENDQKRDEEEQYSQFQEGEERLRMRENVERRKMKATEEQMKTLCISCNEEGEPFGTFCPMGPTFKKLLIQFYPKEMEERMTADNARMIAEQTETLNCSLQKKNTPKKVPPVAVTRIDNRLEQYTHAIETSSKEVNATKQVLMDLPPTEAVATKKELFEASEAWSQHFNKATLSKETDDLKVGIVDLITQLVKGISDGDSKSSTFKPAEIKPGDVLKKKNLWENLGDKSSSGMIQKGVATNKKYKFLVKGHGKYVKKAANFKNEKSEGLSNEDL